MSRELSKSLLETCALHSRDVAGALQKIPQGSFVYNCMQKINDQIVGGGCL